MAQPLRCALVIFNTPQIQAIRLSLYAHFDTHTPVVPVGVLLRKEEEGVMGGVTGGVRLPLVWRGGVAVLFLDTPPVMDRDSLGATFFFMVSCSRRAASVMNLKHAKGVTSKSHDKLGLLWQKS